MRLLIDAAIRWTPFVTHDDRLRESSHRRARETETHIPTHTHTEKEIQTIDASIKTPCICQRG